jgi:hypothetical protein
MVLAGPQLAQAGELQDSQPCDPSIHSLLATKRAQAVLDMLSRFEIEKRLNIT